MMEHFFHRAKANRNSFGWDSSRFDTGYSFTGTQAALSSIASDCVVDEGDCLNAVEIFWTPSDRDEVLTRLDMITDFPEIMTL